MKPTATPRQSSIAIQSESEVILLIGGWCLRFFLSDQEVEKQLAGRGISADHVTLGGG